MDITETPKHQVGTSQSVQAVQGATSTQVRRVKFRSLADSGFQSESPSTDKRLSDFQAGYRRFSYSRKCTFPETVERNRQVELRSARRTWTKLLLVWLCLLLFCGGLIILTCISEPCCSLNGDMITVKPLSGIVVKTEIPKPVISQDGNHFSANHDQSDYFRDNLESDHWNCEAEDTCSALRTSQIRCGFDGCSTNQNKSFEKTSLTVAFYKLARNRRADFSEWTTCPETLGVLSDEGQACLYLSVVLPERTVYEVVMSAYEFLLQGQVSRAYLDMHCMVV